MNRIDNIRQILHSNVSDETKVLTLCDFIKVTRTPKDIRALLDKEDITTKLAAAMSDFDRDIIATILDLILRYGNFRFKQIEKIKEMIK